MKHTVPILLAALSVLAPRALAQSELDAVWKDPVFQKQFVAGYGINAELEPRITPEEVVLLEKVRPLMSENLPKAEEALKKGMKPDCSAVLDYNLGSLQFQQDRMPEALESFGRAVAKFPSFRRAWRNLGLIHVRSGNFDGAIGSFIKMLELGGGGDAYAFGLLGFAYASKQDYQPAEAAYRNALLMQPDNTEWRLGLTRCVFRQEKYADCVGLLDVLIAKYPEKAEFWMLQAHAYLGLKEPLKAAVDFEALERLGKATADSSQTLGDIYVGEKLMDLASRSYQRAIELDAQQPVERPLRSAELLASRGATRQSRQLVAKIRERMEERLDDGSRRRLLKLEARNATAEGGGAEVARVLEEVVRLDPLDGEALMLLGAHHSRENQPDQAIFYYERAASLESFAAAARVRHAQVLAGQGRYADALPLLRSAQESRPREDVARYLEQVERLAKARR